MHNKVRRPEDGWITYSRFFHPGLKLWVLVQKNDGSTRTIVDRRQGGRPT